MDWFALADGLIVKISYMLDKIAIKNVYKDREDDQ